MITAALPLFAVAYQLGGLAVVDIVAGVAAMVTVGVLVAAMVVAISTFTKRVQTATLLAYGFTALLTIGSGLAFGAVAWSSGARDDEATAPAILLAAEPDRVRRQCHGRREHPGGRHPVAVGPRRGRREPCPQRGLVR